MADLTTQTDELPILDIYGLEELQQLALHQTLIRRGIEYPQEFLVENCVVYRAALKANVGLAITITSISPRKKVEPK